MMAGHIAPTFVRVANDGAMQRVDAFLDILHATVIKRKEHKVKASVSHPDGFETLVCVSYYPLQGVLDILRRSGDALLFDIVYRSFVAFIGHGVNPAPFYDGQMCPRPVRQCQPPPFLNLPTLLLDGGGLKRKAAEMREAAVNEDERM